MYVHRFQCTISIKSEIKPIPGRMSLLSSESSGFAQMGMLAIPQGQILGSGCGTSSCSSKIGAVSGSSDPGIFGVSSCILGGFFWLCELPDCCPAFWGFFWGLLGDVIIYHVSQLAQSRKNCHALLISDRYLPHLEITIAECLTVTPRSPFSSSCRPRGAIFVPIRLFKVSPIVEKSHEILRRGSI